MNSKSNLTGGYRIGGKIQDRRWTPYSIYHLYSAYHFAEFSRVLEKNYIKERERSQKELRSNTFDKYHKRHRSFVTSSIISSVAFLEAFINEFFREIEIFPGGEQSKQINDQSKSKLLAFVKENKDWERRRILEKYSSALKQLKGVHLERGEAIYQNTLFLIALRNELVHYKPELIERHSSIKVRDGTQRIGRLSFDQLEIESKFAQNPLFEGGNNYFPDRCLGSGCAYWSADSAFDFVYAFSEKMKLKPKDIFIRFKEDARNISEYSILLSQ